jgi:hypothetical protein
VKCARGTADCDVAHEHNAAWLCCDGDDAPYTGWATPADLKPGDVLGYVGADGDFAPGATVVAAARVPGTGMWNLTTHAGSLVVQGDAGVFVFAAGTVVP